MLAAEADYRAVRGPLTRDMVLRSGGRCPAALRRPGSAAAAPSSPRPAAPERHALGIIRHVSDAGHGHGAPVEGVEEIPILRVGHAEIEAFVDELPPATGSSRPRCTG